jgi:hypothetical protein
MESAATAVRDLRDRHGRFPAIYSAPVSSGGISGAGGRLLIWVNAGRPTETALSDWIAASRELALA